MLITECDENSTLGFLELFNKKFANFCTKAPALLSFDSTIEGVLVKEVSLNKNQYFKFDHSKDVKQNIKIIKDWLLENVYPIMIQEKKDYSEYSTEELENIITESGCTLEQAALMKKENVSVVKWRIEKILVKKDELFIRNLDTDKQYRFKLNMLPSTIFLKKLRESWNPKYAYCVFEKKSQLLNEVFSEEEYDSFYK